MHLIIITTITAPRSIIGKRQHPCLFLIWKLFVFHFIWSFLSSVSSLEIWSVYFDETLELIKTNNNRLIQQLIDIPFDETMYMIEIQTYIDSVQNHNRIRRMELSLCEEIVTETFFYHAFSNESIFTHRNGSKYICLQRMASVQMPNIYNQTLIRYPKNVVLPFHKYKLLEKTAQTLLLAIEYLEDYDLFQDNSGFDIYFLDEPGSSIEAGIMAIGFVPDFRFFLPPKLNHWSLKGVCTNSCLYNIISEEIKIVGIIPNTNHHYLEEMTVKITDHHDQKAWEIFSYGPNGHKSIELIEEPVVNIKDKIIVQCNYINTSNKTIKGGFGEDNENCIVWLHYYPNIELDACLSSYSLATMMSLLDLDDINVTITRTNGFDFKIKHQQFENFLGEKDRMKQWNVEKLIRARYSAMKGRQIPKCGWNPMKIELNRRK